MSAELRAGGGPARLLVVLARLRRAGLSITPDLLSRAISRLWDLELVKHGTTILTSDGERAARVLEASSPSTEATR